MAVLIFSAVAATLCFSFWGVGKLLRGHGYSDRLDSISKRYDQFRDNQNARFQSMIESKSSEKRK